MAGDKSQKTEKPTPKRKRDARREGRIARTPELMAWGSMLAASSVATPVMHNLAHFFDGLSIKVEQAAGHPDPAVALSLLGSSLRDGFVAIAPLMLVVMAIGIAGNFAQVGFAPTGKLLKPKFSRINPFSGVKRLLSPASGWEAAKNSAKCAVLAYVSWRTLAGIVPQLIGSGQPSVGVVAAATGRRIIGFVRAVSGLGLALAAVDYGLQRRRISSGLKMTKEEVRQENRQAEGDPLVKGALRQKQRAMSRLRMMAEVARADVVIVNPIHVAVALRYEPAKGAPRVVAKGTGEVATRIREEADRHGVPLVENIPLARLLNRVCDLGQEIPAELYEAVARVLAFVFALRTRGRFVGHHRVPGLVLPETVGRRGRVA